MEKNIYYPLEHGWYDSKDKWNNFCSSNCRYSSDCSDKNCSESLLQENSVDYGELEVISGGERRRVPLFWRFREGEGNLQPWRRKLWELKK